MTYEDVIAGLSSLRATDFDYSNADARGWETLHELTDGLLQLPSPERVIPALFAVMERMPDADLGSPGPLVHTLERLPDYEMELVKSIRKCPSLLSVWMLNRILNTQLPNELRQMYMALLHEAADHPLAPADVRDEAHEFLTFQATERPQKE